MTAAQKMMMAAPAAGGGFQPGDIAGLAAWWDASDASTITDTGGLVDSWDDKSGNAATLTATTTQRPTTASSSQNGLNTLTLNGTSTVLRDTTVDTLTTDNTVFCVMKSSATAATRSMFNGTSGTYQALYITGSTGSKSFNLYRGGVSVLLVFGDETVWRIYTYKSSSASFDSFGRVNGVQGADQAVGSSKGGGWTLFANHSGTAEFWEGEAAEVIAYDTALSDADIASVETYLSDKWGITIA